jgi:hypothetical protein
MAHRVCTKRCARCTKTLTLDCFGWNAGAKDGLQAYCRECSRDYSREHSRWKAVHAGACAHASPNIARLPEHTSILPDSRWALVYGPEGRGLAGGHKCLRCAEWRVDEYFSSRVLFVARSRHMQQVRTAAGQLDERGRGSMVAY